LSSLGLSVIVIIPARKVSEQYVEVGHDIIFPTDGSESSYFAVGESVALCVTLCHYCLYRRVIDELEINILGLFLCRYLQGEGKKDIPLQAWTGP
jgi:hypothetical protein